MRMMLICDFEGDMTLAKNTESGLNIRLSTGTEEDED
jgi:hypothetical protein